MARINLPYVQEFVDRHGKVRRYFRKNGKRTPLPGPPGSKEFREAYEAAASGEWDGEAKDRDVSPPGSINRLVALYYSSAVFKGLEPITQSTYRNEIEKIRKAHGEKRVAMLKREHVKKLFAEKAEKPGAANKFLRHMRTLMRFAIDENWRSDDRTFGIRKMKIKNGGSGLGRTTTSRSLRRNGQLVAVNALRCRCYSTRRKDGPMSSAWAGSMSAME
jgi:hypothetical protein